MRSSKAAAICNLGPKKPHAEGQGKLLVYNLYQVKGKPKVDDDHRIVNSISNSTYVVLHLEVQTIYVEGTVVVFLLASWEFAGGFADQNSGGGMCCERGLSLFLMRKEISWSAIHTYQLDHRSAWIPNFPSSHMATLFVPQWWIEVVSLLCDVACHYANGNIFLSWLNV